MTSLLGIPPVTLRSCIMSEERLDTKPRTRVEAKTEKMRCDVFVWNHRVVDHSPWSVSQRFKTHGKNPSFELVVLNQRHCREKRKTGRRHRYSRKFFLHSTYTVVIIFSSHRSSNPPSTPAAALPPTSESDGDAMFEKTEGATLTQLTESSWQSTETMNTGNPVG